MSDLEAAHSESDLGKTLTLTERDIREAARLFQLLSSATSEPLSDPALIPPAEGRLTRQMLDVRARIVLNSRRLRWRYFSPAIFGEPAWDILLALYITDIAGDRQTIGKLADWIKTPPSTIVRWVGYLERERLVERQAHPTDRRTMFIKLSGNGRKAIDEFLSAIPG